MVFVRLFVALLSAKSPLIRGRWVWRSQGRVEVLFEGENLAQHRSHRRQMQFVEAKVKTVVGPRGQRGRHRERHVRLWVVGRAVWRGSVE